MSEDNNENRQKLINQFHQKLNSVDVEAERDFINELIDTVTEPLKKVPEPVFREIFLPYFTGEKQPSKEMDAFSHWMGLVGSPTSAAEVVDHKGDVLFTVPPMVDTSRLDPAKRGERDVNFGKVFEVFEEESKVHPAMGKRWLAEQLAKKSQNIMGSDAPSKHSWVPVLKYYDLLPVDGEAKATTATPGDDDLDFGDD